MDLAFWLVRRLPRLHLVNKKLIMLKLFNTIHCIFILFQGRAVHLALGKAAEESVIESVKVSYLKWGLILFVLFLYP